MALGSVTPVAIDAALDLGVEVMKKGIDQGAERGGEAAGEGEKDAADEILASFHDLMAVRFEHLRELTPAVSTDAQLLAWFRLAAAEGPLTESFFEHEFIEKLKAVREAKVTSVGEIGGALLGNYETRLQWRTRGGRSQLAIVRAYVSGDCAPT